MKLFCFPYAGGSSTIFNKWKRYLDPGIELRPVELAGRGARIQEALYKDMPAAVADVFQLIREEIAESPYALFGHSLGSLIIYQLAARIQKSGLPAPAHIFFSGRNAPHVKKDEKRYDLMDNDEFIQSVIGLGGTPPAFFEHPELIELFLPLLKNDFILSQMEDHSGEITPFDTNITVFLGKQESLTPEQCDGWKLHTRGCCTVHYFEGDHFFLHHKVEEMVLLINRTLMNSNTSISTSLTGDHVSQ